MWRRSHPFGLLNSCPVSHRMLTLFGTIRLMDLPSTLTYVSRIQRCMAVKVLGPNDVLEFIDCTGVD